MCGICGELRFDGQQPTLAVVHRMMEKLARRGPDNAGDYIDGPLAMGHRRLSIIDLSEHANQPMFDKRLGLCIVFNGTIYNYPVLRAELISKGYSFFSEGDTEVILKAYAEWGEHCVTRLHGMFAFAIWDNNNRSLFLARDRLGIKPLYYVLGASPLTDGDDTPVKLKNHFRFASNLQALLAAGNVDTSIDPIGLHHQLTLHAVIPAPHTILKGVKKLAPGHTLRIAANGDMVSKPYWRLTATRSMHLRGEAEWIDAIHVALRQAVERRKVIADVPVGVLLSGGLDSSLLVGLLAEAGVRDLRTFSIGFEDVGDERGSEFEYSDQVVAHFNTQHQKIRIPNNQVLLRLPEAVKNMAEPMVGQDAVAFYLLSEQVAKDVKVVQSGQGADEVFGGYFWYPLMAAAQGSDVQRFAEYYFDRHHDEYLQTVDEQYHGDDYTTQRIAHYFQSCQGETFMDRVLNLDVTTLVVDDPVKRVDNMTMAWGLEARVPFLDHELVELAAQMPVALKLKSAGKHPLKQIARGLLPDAVIDRPKGYFPMPALKYVRGEFYDFMREILNSNACRQRGLYQRHYVEKLLAAPEDYFTKIQGSKLWHLALLEYWLQVNVDH
ncbi:MAG: N-acetylglutaminylglutamine amidotransferase [Gammaproteobacteria bacterium]|nr:N-acetylglutaminylglutamine amidotransferase [Gammaproteobacteria bacterium]